MRIDRGSGVVGSEGVDVGKALRLHFIPPEGS